jgi:hypothetical protein
MEAHLTLEPSEFVIEQLRHYHGFVNAHYRFVSLALESKMSVPNLELFMIILNPWRLRMETWRFALE